MDVDVVVGFLERDETKKQNQSQKRMRKTKSRQSWLPEEKQNLRNDKQADPILSLPLSAESCWVVVRRWESNGDGLNSQ